MKCPVCKISTTAVEYDKIELDYCSRCHGIWFDRGELELLLDTLTRGATRELVNSLMQLPQQKASEKKQEMPYLPQGDEEDRHRIGPGNSHRYM